jgi:hypothetical protein
MRQAKGDAKCSDTKYTIPNIVIPNIAPQPWIGSANSPFVCLFATVMSLRAIANESLSFDLYHTSTYSRSSTCARALGRSGNQPTAIRPPSHAHAHAHTRTRTHQKSPPSPCRLDTPPPPLYDRLALRSSKTNQPKPSRPIVKWEVKTPRRRYDGSAAGSGRTTARGKRRRNAPSE